MHHSSMAEPFHTHPRYIHAPGRFTNLIIFNVYKILIYLSTNPFII